MCIDYFPLKITYNAWLTWHILAFCSLELFWQENLKNLLQVNFYCMCRKIPFVTCIMFQQFKLQKLAIQSTFLASQHVLTLHTNFF